MYKKLHHKHLLTLVVYFIFLFYSNLSYGQDTLSVNYQQDSLGIDTVTRSKSPKSNALDARVDYSAADSIIYDWANQKIHLYKDALVTYEDIELKADYIEFNMTTEEVFACGMPDSSGTVIGKPIFKQAEEEFDAERLTYNFGTKRGYIEAVITEQEGGYLHSEQTKRQENGHIHIKNGKYTTCDAVHPHYYIGLKKAIVKPNDKIVSGPAYIVIADVPMPIILPFGFFPNTNNRSAGILIPSFGEEQTRGFYIQDLGYYWPINEYIDLELRGTYYFKNSWGFAARSDYRKRYAYNGGFNFNYREHKEGDRGFDQTTSTNWSLVWNHRQDAKANPTSTFSASVNLSSSEYDQEYSHSTTNRQTNQKTSSVSYSKSWPNTPFRFSGSMNHSQNSQTGAINMNVPNLKFTMNRIYPFRSLNKGKKRFYDDIEIKYDAKLDNKLSSTDTTFFTDLDLQNFENSLYHSAPISIPIKLFNTFTFRPTIGYKGYVYTKYIEKVWEPDTSGVTAGSFQDVTYHDLSFVNTFNYIPSLNLSFDKKLYGMYQSTKEGSKVMALRHVITPSASLNINPATKGQTPDYYHTAYTDYKRTVFADNLDQLDVIRDSVFYSIYENELVRPPGVTKKTNTTGSINLSLNQNFEMKLRSPNDSTDEVRKVKLLDNLKFSTNYNIFADSMNWSDIAYNTGTSFWDNKINIRVSGRVNPYTLNEGGNVTRHYELREHNRIGRLTNTNLSVGMSFKSAAAEGREQTDVVEEEIDETGYSSRDLDYGYVDFSIPWNFRMDYSMSYQKPKFESRIVQTLSFSGGFSLTSKWKITGSSGYDMQRKEITTTSMSIHRDLHCWEMSLRLTPFGIYKSWNFKINVKSSVLRDLKYEMKKNWRDTQ